MTFYYLIASLPALSLGAPPPMTVAGLLEDVRRLADPVTADELAALVTGDGSSAYSALAARWRAAQTQLANALARTRAAQLDVDPAAHLRPHEGFSTYIEMAVLDAYAKPHPLERELSLDRFRWSLLDEWAREQPFGLEALLAYGLKLKLVERWAALTDEAGRTRLAETVKTVREALAK